jgi:hypothetical protein
MLSGLQYDQTNMRHTSAAAVAAAGGGGVTQ